MNRPSAAPRSTTLVSPVTIGHVGLRGGGGHAGADRLELGEREPLLDHEGRAQSEGAGAGGGEVVDGAGHREATDVAAGEAQRLDDVGVGGEGDAAARREGGRVVEPLEHRVGEGRHEHVAHQVAVEPAAAAVAEQDAAAHGPLR